MLGGAWKACSASFGFSAPLSPLLSAERSLLIAHLAQAGSHGLKLCRLDVIDGGMVREADHLIFFVAEEALFGLTWNRHLPFLPFDPLKLGQAYPKDPTTKDRRSEALTLQSRESR